MNEFPLITQRSLVQIEPPQARSTRDTLQPLEALAHCGTAMSFTRCCGGPGTPWPCQARGCGRNIENFGDGQRLPKLRAGCSSHPGGTIGTALQDRLKNR